MIKEVQHIIEKNFLSITVLCVGLIIGWTNIKNDVHVNAMDLQEVKVAMISQEEQEDEIIDRLARLETKIDTLIDNQNANR